MTQPTDRDTILRLVQEVNAVYGLRFDLQGRCGSGLQGGAWMLADSTGQPAVLKLRPAGPGPDIRRIAGAVDRVRAAGYPTPAWLASGTTATGTWYWVQDHVPGQAATPLTPSTAELLIDVLERQAGLDPAPDRDWRSRVTAMALSGGRLAAPHGARPRLGRRCTSGVVRPAAR
jgi:hypothetical protein